MMAVSNSVDIKPSTNSTVSAIIYRLAIVSAEPMAHSRRGIFCMSYAQNNFLRLSPVEL